MDTQASQMRLLEVCLVRNSFRLALNVISTHHGIHVYTELEVVKYRMQQSSCCGLTMCLVLND
jgi:hypothetical protein